MKYIAKRLLYMIPMLLGISFISYATILLSPGGPISFMADLNPKVSQEVREKWIKQNDLDKPIHVQYIKWLKRMIRFDYGNSFVDNQPVLKKIRERLPKTLLLTIISLFLSFLLAIPIGVLSAVKHNSWFDRFFSVFVFIGFSVPTYWIALLLMIFFGIHLGWFPITGYQSIFSDGMTTWQQIIDIAHHLALPLIVTSLTSLAGLSRYMRNGMLEVIRQDYIRTARAKGLPEGRVIWVHALKNTLIPLVTILGLSLPGLISGGVIFETIFSYPGLGRLAYESVMARDFPVIMATITIGAFLTLIGNFIADICYAFVDPRIRYQ